MDLSFSIHISDEICGVGMTIILCIICGYGAYKLWKDDK